jgi:hypothetical protein
MPPLEPADINSIEERYKNRKDGAAILVMALIVEIRSLRELNRQQGKKLIELLNSQ